MKASLNHGISISLFFIFIVVCNSCLHFTGKNNFFIGQKVFCHQLHIKPERISIGSSPRESLVTGGSSGGILDKSWIGQEKHAETYYKAIRNRKSQSDIQAIVKNTGFSIEDITAIRNHIFIEEHDFADGEKGRFDCDINIALAWQRLEQGNFTDLDILLLNHELEELTIMKSTGYYYEKAHELANKKYNWQKEV